MSIQAFTKTKITEFKAAKARNLNNPTELKNTIAKQQAYFQAGGEFLQAAGVTDALPLVEKVLDLFEAEAKVIDQQAELEAEFDADPAE